MYDLIDPFGTFINSQLPTIPTNRLRPGYGIQVAHTWTISPLLISEGKVNTSWNGQRIPPSGDYWRRDTYGFTFPQLFSGGRFDNGIPDTSISGFASFNGPAGSLLSPTTDFSFRKRFRIREGTALLFQGDLFNAFNHANFRNPGTNYGRFDPVTGRPSNASFGVINAAGPGRNIQLGLRLTF